MPNYRTNPNAKIAQTTKIELGSKIGRWTVIRVSYTKQAVSMHDLHYFYLVRCICGTETVRPAKALAASRREGSGGCPSVRCRNEYKKLTASDCSV